MTTFQERFDLLFEESEKSQKEFGSQFGASSDQVFNWRHGRGEPDSETLKKIASIHHVSVDWLVGKTNIRKPIETIAAHRSDDPMDDLPPEALERIEEFKELMRLKYKKN